MPRTSNTNKVDNNIVKEDSVNEIQEGKLEKSDFIDTITQENEIEEATEESKDTKTILAGIQNSIKDVSKKDIDIDTKTVKVKIRADELIPIRSVTTGGFNWVSPRSKISYRWPNMGHLEHLSYEETYQLYTNNKAYLTKPNLIIEDERVISEYKLLPIYENIYNVNQLDKALNNEKIMQRKCEEALLCNMRDLLVSRLMQLYKDKILTNSFVIKTATEILNFEIDAQ